MTSATFRTILCPLLGAASLLPALASAQLAFPGAVARTTPAEPAGLQFKAALQGQSNDNVYGTTTPASDFESTQTLGLSLGSAISRQNFTLDASVSNNQYQTHSDLNYTGRALNGAWQWESGSSLFGLVSANQTVTQNAVGTSINSTQRNLNTTQSGNALLGYEIGGGWQASTGVFSYNAKNEQQVYGQALSSGYSAAYLGGAYVLSSGSTLSVRTLSGSGNDDNNFTVHANELRLDGVAQSGAAYGAQLVYWEQDYAAQSNLNFSGWMGRATVTWLPTEKTSVPFELQRQLNGVVQSNATYTINDSVSVNPSWQMTSTLALHAGLQNLVIRYQGDPGGGASGEIDYLRMQMLGLHWQPRESVAVDFNLNQTARTTNLDNTSIQIHTVSLAASLAF